MLLSSRLVGTSGLVTDIGNRIPVLLPYLFSMTEREAESMLSAFLIGVGINPNLFIVKCDTVSSKITIEVMESSGNVVRILIRL